MQANEKTFLRLAILMVSLGTSGIQAQQTQDSTYLPQITINSLNGYGPYVIGTQRTNYFMAYDLPQNTYRIIFRFIDSKGDDICNPHTEEGQYLQSAFWLCESDTIDFPLAPRLNVEVDYQVDSVANYYIPYLVYPDTIVFTASAGWGPFITNNYTLTDTSWHPVPVQYNTFKVTNLPPRTDSVRFTVYTIDSLAIDSLYVVAAGGHYLDSAAFENVRMDLLPLSTAYIEAVMFCESGPADGIVVSKELSIVPQKPKLFCKTDEGILLDSIPPFVQNQTAGQALLVDTCKHAEIQNGPGIFFPTLYGINYRGPYSFDIIEGTFTLEAWLRFNTAALDSTGVMTVMSVENLWELQVAFEYGSPTLYFYSEAGGQELLLAHAYLPIGTVSQWHHVAYTYEYSKGQKGYDVKVYLDGNKLGSVQIYESTFLYIAEYIPYENDMVTKPLILGDVEGWELSLNTITAMDEVRIWDYARTAQEIKENFKKTILQDYELVGYWNFDDRRNRLKTVSDNSYKNNTGTLENGAYFIPESTEIEHLSDTLTVISSIAQPDSIRFTFVDRHNTTLLDSVICSGNTSSLVYDISALPYDVRHLLVSEYYPGCPDTGFATVYQVSNSPPAPIATPKYNWCTFYQSDSQYDELKNSIQVSGLPQDATRIVCGLEKDNVCYDTMTFYQNSVPFNYSLNLNGTDNYAETSQHISAPTDGWISLWFNTSTAEGGKLFGFSQTQDGIGSTQNEREIIIETDGSVRFIVSEGYVLYAEHAYNDGQWHKVEAIFGSLSADLYMDGSLVDHTWIPYLEGYDGYWLIGRNHVNKTTGYPSLAEYFKGSLAQVYIWTPNEKSTELLYNLDEGGGTTIEDSKGDNDGTLIGGAQRWLKADNNLSFITWEGNMIDKSEGTYDFFAKLFYPGCPATGTSYTLGKFSIMDPVPGYYFRYDFSQGIGYFNEGVLLVNELDVMTDYTKAGSSGWKEDFVQCLFLSPEHYVIHKETETYTEPNTELTMSFDMGDGTPGSYMSIQLGYITTTNDTAVQISFPVPIYINPIIAPTVSGDMGPFLQAIAPGTMVQDNTFTISTEHLSDFNKVTGKFYNTNGTLIKEADAVMINDTTWHLTADMGSLSPPETRLKIEYYLGQYTEPALIEGPYTITIHKTRPRWFDFMADTSFHNIQETGDQVTFSIITYLCQANRAVATSTFKIPTGIPFMGGTEYKTKTPTLEAYLKFIKSKNKLELAKAPTFHKELFLFKLGPPEILDMDLQMNENDFYYLDDKNDLVATQNFAAAMDLTWSIKRIIENPITKMMELYQLVKAKNWQDAKPLGPTANFTVSPTIGYASRLHYTVDTISGEWGSFGSLKIDANPNHPEAFKKSSSFHFVFMGMNNELSIGVTFASGLVDVYAALALGLYVGMGSSFIDIPKSDHHFIMSALVQLYFRVYLTALWSWYEVNLYGPKPIFRWSIGEDNMTQYFPPYGNTDDRIKIYGSALSPAISLEQIKPVGWYSKMALPIPQHSISLRDKHRLFAWLEPGDSFGERNLLVRHFNSETGKFNSLHTLSTNRNAIQNPSVEMLNDHIAVCTWMQTRHTPETIQTVKSFDLIESLARSQDIWYAVYDLDADSMILTGPVDDDMTSLYSGRAEANPEITVLSEDRALITWQVADLESGKSDIWYALVEKVNGHWIEAVPAVLAEPGGIQTHVRVASVIENKAVAVWKNFDKDTYLHNRLMTSVFDGTTWTEPVEMLPADTTIHFNYFDLDFENNRGGIAFTTYSNDPATDYNETLSVLPWNYADNFWSSEPPTVLHNDRQYHIQSPAMTINQEGKTAVAFKLSQQGLPLENKRISQVDLLSGEIANPTGEWKHIPANDLVCDTTKQVADIEVAYAGGDTLMILSHEFVMAATNVNYIPTNGLRFGHDQMNLVLRSVRIDENGNIEDVDENTFFHEADTIITYSDVVLEQNFPNPCSKSTRMKFYLPVRTNARLEIINIQGTQTWTVLDRVLDPGGYEIEINTGLLRQGVYLYKLTTENVVKSLKMIVGN
jgi:hypothetical protein